MSKQKLSLREAGLLRYALSQGDEWNFDFEQIKNTFDNTSISTIRRVIKSLENKGYVYILKSRDSSGRFLSEYYFYESPSLNPYYHKEENTRT